MLPSASLAVHDFFRSYCFCPLQAHVIPYGQKVRTTVPVQECNLAKHFWYFQSLAHAEPQSETKWILHGMGGVGLGWAWWSGVRLVWQSASVRSWRVPREDV